MAYLDDNNLNLTSQGDPLEQLDRELAELTAELDELSGVTDNADEPQKKKEKSPHLSVLMLILVLCLLLVGCSAAEPPAETVTIDDSEMGTVVIEPVEGAETNPYTEQGLKKDKNGYYEYYENGEKISHLGVDISEYQGDVDFEKLKAAGAEFVILRIGGRYYGDEGKLYEDSAFDTYYEQAKAAGLKVGAYFFSQAASEADAKEEADAAIKKLNGRALDYPLALDWENIGDEPARTDDITGDELTLIAKAFCDEAESAGYKSIVYANSSQMFVSYDFNTMKDYDFWLADYRDFPTMYYNFDMWQYSDEGTIDGIDGPVDLNISFTDFT